VTKSTKQRHDPEEDVELGEEVAVRSPRPSGPVVAVRMSRDLLARISDYAQLRGLTVSDVMREGAAVLIRGTVQLGPTYITGVQAEGRSVVSGSPSRGGQMTITKDYESAEQTPPFASISW